MRPSNVEVAKSVAGAVLTEVFQCLADAGLELSTTEMVKLIGRVEQRLQRQEKGPSPEKKPSASGAVPLRAAGQ